MNLYIDDETRFYPLTEADIQKRLPTIDLPFREFGIPKGYSQVIKTERPVPAQYQTVSELTPVQNTEGMFIQTFRIDSIFNDVKDEEGVVTSSKEDQEAALLKEAEAKRHNEVKNIIVREINKRLDAFAKAKQYDNISMLVLRAGYAGPFQNEGLYGAILMDQTWKNFIDFFDQVKMGLRQHPESFKDIEDALPELIWN